MNKSGTFFLTLLFSLNSFLIYSAPLCISLGNSCAPALNLRSLGIRHTAFPFDWIVSPFDAIYNVLNNDFEHFLEDLTPRPDNGGLIDHYGFHFTHDWPTVHVPQVQIYSDDIQPNGHIFAN